VKYRGRLKVHFGVKLCGIMDETWYLKENEIYSMNKSAKDGRQELCDPSAQGWPMLARSYHNRDNQNHL
jgi:hypothetical protein